MNYEDEHWSRLYIPEEKLHSLLEAIANAFIERLRALGLTGVVVSYDDEEGRTHVTAYFEKYPQTFEEDDAIGQGFSEVYRRFFDDAVLIFHIEEEDGGPYVSSDHLVALQAA
jgi:hypothetical protein